MRSLRYGLTIVASVAVGVGALMAAVALMMMISTTVVSASLMGILAPGTAAPDFELPDLDGKTVRLSDYRGKPLVLVFWADWEPQSKALVPEFNRILWDGIPIVGINLIESRERTARAVNNHNIRYPVALDLDGAVGRAYGVETVPTVFVIDADGLVVDQGGSNSMLIPEIRSLLDSAVR